MNFTFRSLRHVALVATVALSTLAPASATMLMDNMFVTPDEFVGGLGTKLVGDTFDVNGVNALGETAFTGLLRSAVFRRANDGGLTFYYQYLADANSSASSVVNRMTATNFAAYSTNVSFTSNTFDIFTDLGTVLATSADRSNTTAAPNDGRTVGFDRFTGGINNGVSAGEISRILAIRTNATTYVPGTTSFINGGVATLATYAPSGPRTDEPPTPEVPEPSTFALLGGGLLGLAGLARRRRS